ncbi:hypothetical protein CYY_003271 [Polysphondylium violaceum]|uniref:Acyl carrier protein n=1 Tax=Polysphondylium violaceum TaxID=133409 RepID=A0A8J4PY16_9MYCE|nr:hypothetical protein CYY_003271 [Polysphondylium violaceum]
MIRSTFSAISKFAQPTFTLQASTTYGVRYFGGDARLGEKEITERVVDVVSKYDKVAGKSVSPNSTFKELGLDSLDSADILVAVEEEFGIEIPDEEADKITSCLQTIDYIKKTPTAK